MGKRYERLNFVLQKSAMFSSVLKMQMDKAKEEQQAAAALLQAAKKKAKSSGASKTRAGTRGRKRARVVEDNSSDDDSGPAKRVKTSHGQISDPEPEDEEPPIFPQPALITGAKMKPYQLEGLQWMVCGIQR